ncbi:MAG: WD40 repeat domain-containing protein [Actinomycetaceae bacterium]|nr:WD40 repeat domain-containing protein [Actinomycetaceae bacterium]
MESELEQAPPSSMNKQWVRTICQRKPVVDEDDRRQRHVWGLADLSNANGRVIVTVGDAGFSLWELDEGRATRIGSQSGISIEYCLADSRLRKIVTLSHHEGEVHIWDAHSLSAPIMVAKDITHIYLCGSGKVAALDYRGSVRIFSTENGCVLKEFFADKRDSALMDDAPFSAEARFLVHADCKQIIVWDIDSGVMCKELILPDSAWLSDGLFLDKRKVAAIDLEGSVYIWNLDEDSCQEILPQYRGAEGWLGQLISLQGVGSAVFAAAAWGPGEEGWVSIFDSEGRLVDGIALDAAPTAIAALAGGGIAVGYGDGWEVYEWKEAVNV